MARTKLYIREVDYSQESLTQLRSDLEKSPDRSKSEAEIRHLFRFPTVYIVHNDTQQSCGESSYNVYVGETSNIEGRTLQHLNADSKARADWEAFARAKNPKMFVIGHDHFNKSLTLDIENRLMSYLVGVDCVKQLNNRRTNQQLEYYTQDEFDEIFSKIWRGLRKKNKRLFPAESIIRDSALFKASPFHKLTQQQLNAKSAILGSITEALQNQMNGQLILVSGDAGAGKTVLLSSLFFELFQASESPDDPMSFQDLDAYLLVNHVEQLTVYETIARRLGVLKKDKDRVSRPTRFINQHDPSRSDDLADVVLVDEAHLLWTQGKQGYRGKNMLEDLLKRSKVVVAVFDEKQVLAGNQFWEQDRLKELEARADQTIRLTNQMRMDADPSTVQWIRQLIEQGTVGQIPPDSRNYEIKIFEDPHALRDAIKQKATANDDRGLSRLVATFDWQYSSARKPPGGTWNVEFGDFCMPWNREIELSSQEKRAYRGLSWAEQPQTIDEVGSTFTIQGFDLNVAGVILGPSVQWRDGRIVHVPSESKNSAAKNKRTLSDGSKADVAEHLLRNELNVLLTRGVHGLYIYAVDPELRARLKEATDSAAHPTN